MGPSQSLLQAIVISKYELGRKSMGGGCRFMTCLSGGIGSIFYLFRFVKILVVCLYFLQDKCKETFQM
jgi:hypothetical protein